MLTNADIKSSDNILLSLAKYQNDEKLLDNKSPHPRVLKAQSIKGKVDKQDFINIENFYSVKDSVKRMKNQAIVSKLFAKHASDKRLISIIQKELPKHNSRKTNNPFRKQKNDVNRNFSEWNIQKAHNTSKEVLLHQPLGKCKLKPQGDTIIHLTKWLKQKIVITLNADEDVEKLVPSSIAGENAKRYS